MTINIKLPDNLFTKDEKQKLKALFRVKGNKGYLKCSTIKDKEGEDVKD